MGRDAQEGRRKGGGIQSCRFSTRFHRSDFASASLPLFFAEQLRRARSPDRAVDGETGEGGERRERQGKRGRTTGPGKNVPVSLARSRASQRTNERASLGWNTKPRARAAAAAAVAAVIIDRSRGIVTLGPSVRLSVQPSVCPFAARGIQVPGDKRETERSDRPAGRLHRLSLATTSLSQVVITAKY